MPLPNILEFIGTNITQRKFQEAQEKLLNYLGIEVPTKTEFNSAISNVNNAITPKADKTYVDTALAGFTNGVSKFYPTLAAANADITNITIKDKVDIGEIANGGTWYKETTGATGLTKSPYDPLLQAKGYTDLSTNTLKENFIIEQSDLGIFFLTLDRVPLFYVLNDGSFHLAGDSTDLREHIKNINELTNNEFLYEFKDVNGNHVAYIKSDGGLYIVGDNASLQDRIVGAENTAFLSIKIASISDAQGKTIFASSATRTFSNQSIKNLSVVEPFPKIAGKIQRIGAALKLTNNRILYFWGGGYGAPYNGDGEGVILYKRILTYSDNGYIADKGVKELFSQTPNPAGIAKHPMLGRTAAGRIILIWDERDSVFSQSSFYKTKIAFSDDEGLTFTAAIEVPRNPAFTFQALGSTGTIITLSTGRIVCPVYYFLPFETMGMMYSDDNGVTWQYGAVLNIPNAVLQEPAITFDEANKIYVSCRTTSLTQKLKHISTSIDGGQTLQSVGFHADLSTPNVASTIYYDFENKLMLHGGATNKIARDKYQIQISADKAVTFPVSYQPFADNFYIGYSHLIKLSADKYALVVEGLNDLAVVNSAESIGIFIFNLKEVFSHVSRN